MGEASVKASVADLLSTVAAVAWDRIAVTLTRLTGDRELAEDCVQDAFARALVRWPVDGVPGKPMAWLMTTARNRALDRARRAMVEAAKLRLIARETAREPPELVAETGVVADDRLELMFACAHPALPMEAQVALSLSSLAGLPAAEIADAFFVTERTMRQRLFRAKQRLRRIGAPYLPPDTDLRTRVPAVLRAVFLMFNAGYGGLGIDGPVRPAMMDEALRLGRLLVDLMPGDPEAAGLLALMLLHHARRGARGIEREFVALPDQDRSRWDLAEIAEGIALAHRAAQAGRVGPFQLRAAIAACHDSAPTAAETDWWQISMLYGQLPQRDSFASVAPFQSLPVSVADSPEAGLLIVAEPSVAKPDDEIETTRWTAGGTTRPAVRYQLLPGIRGHLLLLSGLLGEAADAYRESLDAAAAIAAYRAELAEKELAEKELAGKLLIR
jgi:RNA polymerase sigma-70 factor, ECF subfamily